MNEMLKNSRGVAIIFIIAFILTMIVYFEVNSLKEKNNPKTIINTIDTVRDTIRDTVILVDIKVIDSMAISTRYLLSNLDLPNTTFNIGKTDVSRVKGFIFEKKSFLDNGVILYFKYYMDE